MFDIILLCGGKGSRFTKISKGQYPKSLHYIEGKPLIQYTLESLEHPHIDNYIFAVDYMSEVIEESVKNFMRKEYIFSYQDISGVYGAFLSASKLLKNKYCILCNTDEIRKGFDINSFLIEFLKNHERALMLCGLSDNLQRHRHITEINQEGFIKKTNIKPKVENSSEVGIINCGMIVLKSSLLSEIDISYGRGWECLIDMLVSTSRVSAYIDNNVKYFNIGTEEELVDYYNYQNTRLKDEK